MAYFGLAVFALFALAHNGAALRCWSCSTDLDFQCGDTFNTTRLLQLNSYSAQRFQPQGNFRQQNNNNNNGPHLVECTSDFSQQYNQRQVCLKRVINVPYGKKIVSRECKTVSAQQAVGTCSPRNNNEEFCETCEYDGCNGAHGIGANTAALIALPVLALFFRR